MSPDSLFTERQTRQYDKVLIISGVNISQPIDHDLPDRPYPDYGVLLEQLPADVLDIKRVHEVPNLLVRLANRWLSIQWAIAVAALVRAHRYRGVIATGEDVGLRFATLCQFLAQRVPLVITCHNITSRRPSFYLGTLKVARKVRTFQCLSRAQARMLVERFQIAPEQIQLLYWHVDHRFFRPMPEIPLRRQLCSAGMASRDYATLLKAASGLDIEIKIAADSPWFKQELNIDATDLPARVEVRSYGTYQALRQLYAESLFVVVPLFDVPYSAGYTVILEAMAMGKAVIASKITQQDDFIVDGWNGLYVEPGDDAALRERITFLLNNPDEAARLGHNARMTIEQRFTLDHYRARMMEVVQAVLPAQWSAFTD